MEMQLDMIAIHRTAGQNQHAEFAKSAGGLKLFEKWIVRVACIRLMPDCAGAGTVQISAKDAFRQTEPQRTTAALLGLRVMDCNSIHLAEGAAGAYEYPGLGAKADTQIGECRF
ncbi:hypothetical protein GCM10010991_31270 [Gemmobacter aquaticus]|uniref:Uncharacterized protein n=1 Tax=Gemmobacter aquaticus TaxID=490185 RepID=A0A917YPR5_9RHOB|nr:hypothetical protein GCM10010991_31270 [Gemmobacter aquaticus]